MPSSEIYEVTQRKWRDLGFFYDRDDDAKEWRLIGANAGLRQFAHAMQKYAEEPSNHLISEPNTLGLTITLRSALGQPSRSPTIGKR